MSRTTLSRFRRAYRVSWAQVRQERAAREQAARAVPPTLAATAFWLSFAAAMVLNLLDAVVGLEGRAWTVVRSSLGFAVLGFGLWHVSEVLARRRRSAR